MRIQNKSRQRTSQNIAIKQFLNFKLNHSIKSFFFTIKRQILTREMNKKEMSSARHVKSIYLTGSSLEMKRLNDIFL